MNTDNMNKHINEEQQNIRAKGRSAFSLEDSAIHPSDKTNMNTKQKAVTDSLVASECTEFVPEYERPDGETSPYCKDCGETSQYHTTDSLVAGVGSQVSKLVIDGGYTLRGNVITDPGKFEGEHVMTLYFYDAYMNGDGEAYGDENDLKFNISDDEAEAFGIAKGAQVILCFSDQGFVSSYINS